MGSGQLDMLAEPAPEPVVRKPELSFMDGLLASWFETRVGHRPRKADRAVLKACAEQMLVGFGAQVIAAKAADERKAMSEHELEDDAPEAIREDVALPGTVDVPDEIEERLRENPEAETERDLG